jgi:hypothetical protein
MHSRDEKPVAFAHVLPKLVTYGCRICVYGNQPHICANPSPCGHRFYGAFDSRSIRRRLIFRTKRETHELNHRPALFRGSRAVSSCAGFAEPIGRRGAGRAATLRLRSLVQRRVLRLLSGAQACYAKPELPAQRRVEPSTRAISNSVAKSGSPFPIQAAGCDEMRAQRQRLRLPALDCIQGGIVSSASSASGFGRLRRGRSRGRLRRRKSVGVR